MMKQKTLAHNGVIHSDEPELTPPALNEPQSESIESESAESEATPTVSETSASDAVPIEAAASKPAFEFGLGELLLAFVILGPVILWRLKVRRYS